MGNLYWTSSSNMLINNKKKMKTKMRNDLEKEVSERDRETRQS